MELTEEERQQMLKDLEHEAADDLWNFLQDAAEGIKHPEGIKTDEQWPVTHDTVVHALADMHIKRASEGLKQLMLGKRRE